MPLASTAQPTYEQGAITHIRIHILTSIVVSWVWKKRLEQVEVRENPRIKLKDGGLSPYLVSLD